MLLYALFTFVSSWGMGEDMIWRPEMARCYYMLYLPLIQTGGWGSTQYGDLRWLDATRCYYMLYLPLFQTGGSGRTRYGDLRWLDATRCFINLFSNLGLGEYTIWRPEMARRYQMLLYESIWHLFQTAFSQCIATAPWIWQYSCVYMGLKSQFQHETNSKCPLSPSFDVYFIV